MEKTEKGSPEPARIRGKKLEFYREWNSQHECYKYTNFTFFNGENTAKKYTKLYHDLCRNNEKWFNDKWEELPSGISNELSIANKKAGYPKLVEHVILREYEAKLLKTEDLGMTREFYAAMEPYALFEKLKNAKKALEKKSKKPRFKGKLPLVPSFAGD